MVSTADCQKYLQNWFESNKQNLKKDFSVNPDPKPKTWKRRGKAKVGDSTFRTFDDDSASVPYAKRCCRSGGERWSNCFYAVVIDRRIGENGYNLQVLEWKHNDI